MEAIIVNALMPILTTLGTALATALVGYLVKFISTHIGIAKINKANAELQKLATELGIKGDIAKEAVKFAEQAFVKLGGGDKYDMAIKYLSGKLQQHGLPFTPEELEGLIESSLKTLKADFGEKWSETVQSEVANQ